LYRMGDFYELFFQDAVEAAQVLELTLTSRNKNDPEPIPMAGVPHHALNSYLGRLVASGHKVAIAEQKVDESNPKLMTRELVRVVTPGVPWEEGGSVEARMSCWLAGLHGTPRTIFGLAFLDITTGELRMTEVDDLDEAVAELTRMEPRELVISPMLTESPELAVLLPSLAHTAPEISWFDADAGQRALCQVLGTSDLMGFGAHEMTTAVGAAGALISYVRDTARVSLEHVNNLTPYSVSGHMVLDEATRRNLEILRPMRGSGRKGTLLWLLDRSCTAMGGRLLREWLSRPRVDVHAIRRRQDAIEALWDSRLRRVIRESLREVSDLERLASRVGQGSANARDLGALAISLVALPGVFQQLATTKAFEAQLPKDLVQEVAVEIKRWLTEEPPTSLTEGGLIRKGVHEELDRLKHLARDGRKEMALMESRLKESTGISSLKIKHNKVFGYFLEVTHANRSKVPKAWIRKQTLSNAERFITPELKEFEDQVLGADERSRALEYELFRELRDRVAMHVPRIQRLAHAVAYADVIAALAEVAVENRYVRPVVHPGDDLKIIAGRHPVVEAMTGDESFVPNDVVMDENRRLVILTGPNMAGKSTVMRQVALMALMAQIGSFVPAREARIGVCDRIFVRVGASDDLARGRSTFMVEMSETALILNQATSRSLILLDEIGRGTATYDGLAIAWAVAEAVHDRLRARTIFATHYHELTYLGDTRPRACNQHIAVSEWKNQIIFLRTLREGGASKSYGIQCARLAGMPEPVVARAQGLLEKLEEQARSEDGEVQSINVRQLDLFGRAVSDEPTETSPDEMGDMEPIEEEEPVDLIRKMVSEMNPDELSPRQALDLLYQLQDALVLESVEVG
ncbi:MAG: DNA mismatch repair protein MutS, partial [Myxococcota bacterium]